jgi:ubiquinone/menaquinone biosynthesis C-methylase UbiE
MKDEYDLEAKVYDKIWGKYDYDTDVRFLDELFKEHRCRSVVDIGCGTENHSLRLNTLGYEVTDMDINSTMLKRAKSKNRDRKIRFIQGDMKELKTIIPKTRRFDAAISLGKFPLISTQTKKSHINAWKSFIVLEVRFDLKR